MKSVANKLLLEELCYNSGIENKTVARVGCGFFFLFLKMGPLKSISMLVEPIQ